MMTTRSSLFCSSLSVLIIVVFSLRALGQPLAPSQIKALPECALGRTNASCKLVVDRDNPVAPPAVQMYSNQTLTVIIKNPKYYERYFLDYQTGQATLFPDVTSSIVQGLLPSLGKLSEFTAELLPQVGQQPPPDPCNVAEILHTPTANHVKDVVPAFQLCLGKLAADAVDIYKNLEPSLAPDSLTPDGARPDSDFDAAQTGIANFLKSEFTISSRITGIANDTGLKANAPDAPAILQLTDLQKLVDAVANDLLAYSRRIADLDDFDNGARECAQFIDVTPRDKTDALGCIAITSRRDDQRVYRNMVSRTVTYSLNSLNLIANSQEAAVDSSKKKSLATVAITFADNAEMFPGNPASPFRWEASAGAFFSTLPVRSFSAAPLFASGVVTNKKVTQNVLHPTVVPFAAANYRLSNDFRWSRWKSAIYWTAAVGINPNTVSADFATGLSLTWRALMVSSLCHFGHDTRLTQGLRVGESLGAGFNGSLPSQTYWTASFAFGVSVRVPSLTGR